MKDTPKQPLHSVAGWFAHLGLDMPVGRQRKGHRSVTKHLRHDQRLDALPQQKGRSGVSEIMRTDVGQPCPFDEPLVLLQVPVTASIGRASRRAEDKLVKIPVRAAGKPCLQLRDVMTSHGRLRSDGIVHSSEGDYIMITERNASST